MNIAVCDGILMEPSSSNDHLVRSLGKATGSTNLIRELGILTLTQMQRSFMTTARCHHYTPLNLSSINGGASVFQYFDSSPSGTTCMISLGGPDSVRWHRLRSNHSRCFRPCECPPDTTIPQSGWGEDGHWHWLSWCARCSSRWEGICSCNRIPPDCNPGIA